MPYLGHIQNGVVVFDTPVPLPDGTGVRVERIDNAGDLFWKSLTLDQLAEQQNVSVPKSFDEFLGGWPEDEVEDGFEREVVQWRRQEDQR
jgi:hypothetical protein